MIAFMLSLILALVFSALFILAMGAFAYRAVIEEQEKMHSINRLDEWCN